MVTVDWRSDGRPEAQIRGLRDALASPGWLVVRFSGRGDGEAVSWELLEPWRTSRAVTVADVSSEVGSPDLDVALCSDVVMVRAGATLSIGGPAEPCPGPGVIWAAGRAGRRALRAVLLDGGTLTAVEAADLGLAHGVVDPGAELPLPRGASIAAVTAARDLDRARAPGAAGLDLELATFRLLFAAEAPREGAKAFLEKRRPEWEAPKREE